MTGRRSSPAGWRVAANPTPGARQVPAAVLDRAIRRLRIRVATAYRTSELGPGERRALADLIERLARLLQLDDDTT